MTLKSFNTPYVKLIRKVTVMGAGLLLAAVSLLSPMRWSAAATEFNWRHVEADNSIPSLQGAAAITYLKEHKLYESLRTAHAAHTQQGDNSLLAPLFVNKQQLTASDGAFDDLFGQSVAFSGSTIVVGAQHDDIGGNPGQGAAYIFNRQGGDWVETQKLTASDGAADLVFGWSVAFSGSTVVVGAIGDNVFQGAAYVFNRQGGNWVEVQKLTASDGAVFDLFGWSVAISGSTVVVGAFGDNIGDNFLQGAAYVFNRQGGSWIEEQKLTASDGRRDDEFGFSVAVSGSAIVIGALGNNDLQGAAYVFNRQAGSWIEAQKLSTSDRGFFFGSSVTVSGSTVVVGANAGGNIRQGSAYIFEP